LKKESQNIEFKESWNDEYIKWICGFANAFGGTIYIGIKDNGDVLGVYDAQKLLEDIPNKVRDILGILVDVNVLTKENKEYLEIIVEPQLNPVNYKGQYHYRTGTTKQELKGSALNKFMLEKHGKHWDGVPVMNLTIDELEENAFINFKEKASKTQRVSKEQLQQSNKLLLEKLLLLDQNLIKRAGVLLFYGNPEKFISGAYIKMGFFKNESDLIYHDEIHGNLFHQVDKTMDLLLSKYMSAIISYQGVNRIERFPYPESALREAVVNAIVHKDYSSSIPIQISVYPDKLIIWNSGELPNGWDIKRLTSEHPSYPFNPDIANAFFRAGIIESWGRGILKIMKDCINYGLISPRYNTHFSGLQIILFYKNAAQKTAQKTAQKVAQKTTQKIAQKKNIVSIDFTDKIKKNESEKNAKKNAKQNRQKILKIIQKNNQITSVQMANELDVSIRTIANYLSDLKKEKILKRIGPDKGGYWLIVE
jgi:ATP-dependent DNA helicase RecG